MKVRAPDRCLGGVIGDANCGDREKNTCFRKTDTNVPFSQPKMNPSGSDDHTREWTGVRALIQCRIEPVFTSQTETNPSRLLAARRLPQELKATEVMASSWKERSYRFLYRSAEGIILTKDLGWLAPTPTIPAQPGPSATRVRVRAAFVSATNSCVQPQIIFFRRDVEIGMKFDLERVVLFYIYSSLVEAHRALCFSSKLTEEDIRSFWASPRD